ncbi:hypothetical protein H8356DRAFT_1057907 [Neocallimastix lanati (nom. inval.)]|jgi:hypothetical protein|nr:hypothetical protein H8356DRAFT_1057907 [Neocallimastix sp. JGI-2020a]
MSRISNKADIFQDGYDSKNEIKIKDKKKENDKSRKLSKNAPVKKPTGPPDISNRTAIIKVFKSVEAYEAFRNKYLYNNTTYTSENEDRTIEILRNRCRYKKRKQESMFQQAIKNKISLAHNEKLAHTLFREKDFYNNYSKEKLDYDGSDEKLSHDSSDINITDENYMNYVDTDEMDLKNEYGEYNEFKDNNNNIRTKITAINEEENEQISEEEERKFNDVKEKEKEEKEEEEEEDDDNDNNNNLLMNEDGSYTGKKIEIVENIDSKMIEKNSSYKSFSFNDSLKPVESVRSHPSFKENHSSRSYHRNNNNNRSSSSSNSSNSRSNSRFSFTHTPSSTSNKVPLCMDDVIKTSSVKLPVIKPRYRKDWQALNVNEVIEQRSAWNPYQEEPRSKIIIPGIGKQYQNFIPLKNGNNFWRVCSGNIYDNLY